MVKGSCVVDAEVRRLREGLAAQETVCDLQEAKEMSVKGTKRDEEG